MSPQPAIGSPELRDGIACLVKRHIAFPVRAGDGIGSEAGLVYDFADHVIAVADPEGDRPDEEARVIAQAIALALNAASGWNTEESLSGQIGRAGT